MKWLYFYHEMLFLEEGLWHKVSKEMSLLIEAKEDSKEFSKEKHLLSKLNFQSKKVASGHF